MTWEEVAPGVERLMGSAMPRLANGYLLGRSILVDPVLLPEGPITEHVRLIVLTHYHADHAQSVARFAWSHNIPVVGLPPAIDTYAGALVHLREGDPLFAHDHRRWMILHAPGHAPDHLCLFDERERTLIASDMIEGDGGCLIPLEGGDTREHMLQLRRLAQLRPKMILPGHGEPLSGPECLIELAQRQQLRETLVQLAVESAGEQGCGIADTFERVYGKSETPVPFAALHVLTHLHALVRAGRLKMLAGSEPPYSRIFAAVR